MVNFVLIEGKINKVSDDPSVVIPGSNIITIAGPSYAHGEILNKIAKYVEEGSWVGTVFGQGAFDLQAHHALKGKEVGIYALQTVPVICRGTDYGQSVQIIGPKDKLYCAAYPIEKAYEIANMLSLLYRIPTVVLPNFLCITLTPSNQIIHPGRMYGFFKNWDGKTPYSPTSIPHLYDLDEGSANEIQRLDNEIQAIKRKIVYYYPEIDLSLLLPIKERIIDNYGDQISDKSTLRTIFSTNAAYANFSFPLKSVPGNGLNDS